MTSNSDKHGEFRVSFAEILVGFSSDGLVLLPPSDLRSRKQINIGAKQLADYCHIYMVLQRPGLSFVPDQVYDSGDSVYGKLKFLLIKLKQVAKLLQEGGGCGWHRPA